MRGKTWGIGLLLARTRGLSDFVAVWAVGAVRLEKHSTKNTVVHSLFGLRPEQFFR